MPDATFAQRVNAAYFNRVNLSAQGFYATPDVRCFRAQSTTAALAV